MNAKSKILIHKDELTEDGANILSLHGIKFTDYDLHRDDHYMFIIQKSGLFICEVDFNKVELSGAALCYVAPGQIQRYIEVERSEGWLIFLDPNHISQQCRESFDVILNVTQNASLKIDDPIFAFTDNLQKYWTEKDNELSVSIIRSLLDAVVGIIASRLLVTSTKFKQTNSPKYILATRFKHLIRNHFKELKQVKQYASLLHITPLYLNEVMKEITGFPASYWIFQEILIEAKRLLVHSNQDVQEIAWELGYEDHAYFSRFFKKNIGITASAFRSKP